MPAFELPTGGGVVFTPPLTDADRAPCRIVISGLMRFADQSFDAVYAFDPQTGRREEHRHLTWLPERPPLEVADTEAHRYVFRVPATWKDPSIGVGLRTDAFVERFLISPEEVRRMLSGSLHMEVLQAPVAPPSPWSAALLLGGPGAFATGAVGFLIRRRMRFAGISPELRDQMERIMRKRRIAAEAIMPSHERAFPLRRQLGELEAGAFELARKLTRLRSVGDTSQAESEARIQSQLDQIERCLGAAYTGLESSDSRGEQPLQITREVDAAVAALQEVRLGGR